MKYTLVGLNRAPQTALALALLCLGSPALSGCTDPDGAFDDFLDRIPDAAPVPDAEVLSSIPDITGRFFVGMSPSVSPDDHLLFIAENTLVIDGDTALLSFTSTPLDFTTRLPVGDMFVFTDVPVDMAGQFGATVMDIEVPAEANPITQSLLVLSTVTFVGTIRSADLYCGDVEGMVTSPAPIDLAGSTFGAIRVPDGTIGDALPPEVIECPSETPIDAGVPDATPPMFDATPPVFDAGPPVFDATPTADVMP